MLGADRAELPAEPIITGCPHDHPFLPPHQVLGMGGSQIFDYSADDRRPVMSSFGSDFLHFEGGRCGGCVVSGGCCRGCGR